MNKVLVGGVVLGVLGAIALACGSTGDAGPVGATGKEGPSGAAGAPGAPGAPGANGTNGTGAAGEAGAPGGRGEAGAPGGTVIISALAKHGLEISPVPLATAGMTGDQLEQVGLGSYLANAIGNCNGCHGSPTQQFLGGNIGFPLDGAGHVVYTRNLTPDATTGLKLTEAQFIQVFRTGMDFTNSPTDGGAAQSLVVMPWQYFRWLSTSDIKALYAYLKVVPAVNNAVTADNKGFAPPVGVYDPTTYNDGQTTRALPPETDPTNAPVPDPGYVLRGLAIDPIANAAVPGLSAAEQARYGRGSYLVNAIAHCNDCHTNSARANGKVNFASFMTGGAIFPTPPPLQPLLKTTRVMSANLLGPNGYFNATPGGTNFSTFESALMTGLKTDEPPPQAPLGFPMPAKVFRNMTIDDIVSVYEYERLIASAALNGRTDKNIRAASVYCTASTDCDQANGETCDTANKECIARNCTGNGDCPVCQTCGVNSKCALPAPAALGACIAAGL